METAQMITPGRYVVIVEKSGRMTWTPLIISRRKEANLKQLWKPDAPFTFDALKSELTRIGVLQNNFLNLSGKQVRQLYRFLETNNAVESQDMVTVYRCFAGSFKLKFKGATSLQRLKDYANSWGEHLALLRSDSNAIPGNDTMK